VSELDSPDDMALMQRVTARDSSALAALYDRHSPLILALCVRVLRDPAEAEEVLGDVFFEAWNRHDRYHPGRGTPLAYLLTLARSRAIDRLRARRLRDARVVATDGPVEPAGGVGAAANPYQDTVAAEQRTKVLAALAGLTGEQRKAVELSFYEGLSHSEIAASLGEPLGTVKTRIRQGLIQLRRALVGPDEARG